MVCAFIPLSSILNSFSVFNCKSLVRGSKAAPYPVCRGFQALFRSSCLPILVRRQRQRLHGRGHLAGNCAVDIRHQVLGILSIFGCPGTLFLENALPLLFLLMLPFLGDDDLALAMALVSGGSEDAERQSQRSEPRRRGGATQSPAERGTGRGAGGYRRRRSRHARWRENPSAPAPASDRSHPLPPCSPCSFRPSFLSSQLLPYP